MGSRPYCRRAEGVGQGGVVPEHWHWNWAKKASFLSLLTYRCLGIEYKGKTQGLIMIETVEHRAKLAPDKGKPLAYVEFLEAAPWNTRNLTEKPRFRGVGITLFEVAVRLSEQEGFHGRVGLLALPQAEDFYKEHCNMQYVDLDPAENLPYYELTRASAKVFLKKEDAND